MKIHKFPKYMCPVCKSELVQTGRVKELDKPIITTWIKLECVKCSHVEWHPE